MTLIHKGLRLCKEMGGDTYIVGGAVRDMLMGQEIHDIDLATNVPLEEIEKKFSTINIGKNKDFGVINVEFEGDRFEVAHFRQDGAYSDNRRPDQVTFVDRLEDDLARRDFTINAMAFDANLNIIDPFGGRKDIEKKVIRFVGNAQARIAEDGLRVLRAYRFAARFGFNIIEESAMNAFDLSSISQERITDEIKKASSYGPRALAFFLHRVVENGIELYPFYEYRNKFQHQIKHHPEGDLRNHTIACLSSNYTTGDYMLGLCIAFHDIGKMFTRETKEVDGKTVFTYYDHDKVGASVMHNIASKMKLSHSELKILQYVCENHMIWRNMETLKNSKKLEILSSPHYHYLLSTTKADELSRMYLSNKERRQSIADYGDKRYAEIKAKGEIQDIEKTLVNGESIMKLIPGISGPTIGMLKREALEYVRYHEYNVSQQDVNEFIIQIYNDAQNVFFGAIPT